MTYTGSIADRILAAVSDPKLAVSPTAREAGADLAQSWHEQFYERDRAAWRIIAVECPWFLWLDEHTLTVGMQDLIAEDADGVFGGEWKTRRAPKLRKDGLPYKGDSEEEWRDELAAGVQCKMYALALRDGTYVTRDTVLRLQLARPRLRIRAILKTTPPEFWPAADDALFEYSDELLEFTRDALLARAAAIRGARRSGKLPWSLPGLHCVNKYGRVCEYYDQFCADGKRPSGAMVVHDPNDPGSRAIEFAGADVRDPSLVVLSASSFDAGSQCLERYRLSSGGFGDKEASEALDTGTVLHAGAAAMYSEILNEQRERGTDKA